MLKTSNAYDLIQIVEEKHLDYTAERNGITFRNPSKTGEERSHNLSDFDLFGSAGWDYTNKQQLWVGIDFDAATKGGRATCTNEELQQLREDVQNIPIVQARWSTRGRGMHCYVYFDPLPTIETRKESTLLANAVIDLIARRYGVRLSHLIDCRGSNLWLYARDAAPNAFQIISDATEKLDPAELPAGWRDVKALSAQKVEFAGHTTVEPAHEEIERAVSALGYTIVWVPEQNCWHLHTHGLKSLQDTGKYKGHFDTVSAGTDPGKPNAYGYPIPGGGLFVKRFGGAKEDQSWLGDYTLFNCTYPTHKALHLFGNYTSKGYQFTAENFRTFVAAVGISIDVPGLFADRKVVAKHSPTHQCYTVSVPSRDDDPPSIDGWSHCKGTWEASFPTPDQSDFTYHVDRIRTAGDVRAVTNGSDAREWFVQTVDHGWQRTSSDEVTNVLLSEGVLKPSPFKGMLRKSETYKMIWAPFQPEYPDTKKWNPGAPQWSFQPGEDGTTSMWDAIFSQVGSGLDEAVITNRWCQAHGITSGARYLKLWVKLMLEQPDQKLPYLFLMSRENNTGKSSFGQAVRLLVTSGIEEINEESITDKFNAELETCLCALIEELNLSDRRGKAYQTIKRLMTSKTINVRRMRTDVYTVPNFLHFIHTANDESFVPLNVEDERIVMWQVPGIQEKIEEDVLFSGLKKQAPSFMREVVSMVLPPRTGRFHLPVLETSLKENVCAGEGLVTELTPGQESLRDFMGTLKERTMTKRRFRERYAEYCDEHDRTLLPDRKILSTMKQLGFDVDATKKKPYELDSNQRVDAYSW